MASTIPNLRYRPDIDGLRAVSILLVVAFHAGVPGFDGGYVGVDVFFVLSGFLITSLLVVEKSQRGRISIGGFYARRVRRLLPMAALVVIVTTVLGLLLTPSVERRGLALDAIASSLYVANWRSAAQSTAYTDTQVTDNLFLQFWSLSVEEQFYLLWPALLVVVFALAHRLGTSYANLLKPTVAAVVAVSFVASATLTTSLGSAAYFVTYTRVWEMGAGAMLALYWPVLSRLPSRVGQLLGIAGFVVIIWSAFVYSSATPFPGVAALVPVAGTVMVIAAGAAARPGVSAWLSHRPLPALGKLSYAWYLWHWPIIGLTILYVDKVGWGISPGWTTALAVGFSFVVAYLSHVVVEQRVRHSRVLAGWRPTLALGAGLTFMPVVFVVGLMAVVDTGDAPVTIPAASSSTGGSQQTESAMSPSEAAEDGVNSFMVGCHSGILDSLEVGADCVFGDPNGAITVALVGDSHAQHWLPALDAAGKAAGWRVLAWTKSACPFVAVPVRDPRPDGPASWCLQWQEKVMEQLRSESLIDMVIIGRSFGYKGWIVSPEGEPLEAEVAAEAWTEGAGSTYSELATLASSIVQLRDTPWAQESVPSCLASQPATPEKCAIDLSVRAGLDTFLYEAELVAATPEVTFIDFTEVVCPTDPCQVVTRGGTITYRDSHHLTRTYSTQLAPEVAAVLSVILSGEGRDDAQTG